MNGGVVAYLTHSIYGRCNNSTNCVNVSRSSNEVYNTTSGKDTSTTGTIYGVYNMNDGKKEYVMGVLADNIGDSGFSSLPDSKYYNLYSGNYYEESAQIGSKYIGHALKEVDSWYINRGDYYIMDSSHMNYRYPWLLREKMLGMYNVWHIDGQVFSCAGDNGTNRAASRFVITNE